MKISTTLYAAGAAIIVGIAALIATNHVALQELKVRGPLYQNIVLGKDLVADILPPPLHIVEAHLEVAHLLNEPQTIEIRRQRITQLAKEFEKAKARWETAKLDETIRQSLLKEALPPVQRYWEMLDKEFYPALLRKDTAAARQAYARLSETFAMHHQKIEQSVELSNKLTSDMEASSKSSETMWQGFIWMMSFLVAGIAVAIGARLFVTVLRPLLAIENSLLAIAGGKLDLAVFGLERKDEIGAMAKAVDILRLAALDQRRLEAQQAEQRASEQMRQQHLERQVQEFRTEISGVIGVLSSQTSSMRNSASTLITVAGTTTVEAKSASEASQGAADNAQAVAAATEQLGASIREIASQAHRTSDIVAQTTDAARRTNEDVAGLADAAQNIGSIVEIIKTVAEQTNLLALNATIEAARAGEAGKGFAVVASEVKSLAAQTAKATSEISSQIQNVQTSTTRAVEAIRSISSRIDEINGLTGGIAAAVEEQEAATREIAQNVTSAADRSRVAATGVTGVLTAADQTKVEAASMTSTSDELSKATHRITNSFERFVAAVATDIKDRRKAVRHPIDWPTTIYTPQGRFETRAQNISLTGLRIAAVAGLSPGMKVEVDYGDGKTRGQVIWGNATTVGLAFEVALKELPRRSAAEGGDSLAA